MSWIIPKQSTEILNQEKAAGFKAYTWFTIIHKLLSSVESVKEIQYGESARLEFPTC